MAEAFPPEVGPLEPTPADRREARRRAARVARRKRLLAACGCFVFIALLALAIGYHLQTGRWWPAPLGAGGAPIRVLVLGSDGQPGGQGRADTMLLLTINPANGAMGVVSIPRDTRVDIPGLGWGKLNAAYAAHGPRFAVDVVAQLLGVPIDHYLAVDFAGFARVVDALGGVDLTVEEPMNYDDSAQGLHIHLSPGPQHLDGQRALEYVRFRGPLGDIALVDAQRGEYAGRVERELKFVRALMAKATSTRTLAHLPSLWRSVRGSVATDLSVSEVAGLGLGLRNLDPQAAKTGVVPGTGEWIGGVSYWVIDPAGVGRVVAQLARVDTPDSALR